MLDGKCCQMCVGHQTIMDIGLHEQRPEYFGMAFGGLRYPCGLSSNPCGYLAHCGGDWKCAAE